MRRHRLVVVTVLILAAVLGAALPALAAGNPTYYTAGRQTLIYTASSGGQPQGAIVAGQYIRLATADCPMPDRMSPDEPYPYTCPPPVKLPPLPGPSFPVGR